MRNRPYYRSIWPIVLNNYDWKTSVRDLIKKSGTDLGNTPKN
jgi:hypothetical protein